MHMDKHLDVARLTELADFLKTAQPDLVRDATVAHRELTVLCRKQEIVKLLTFLRDDKTCQFKQLIDVCGVDWLGRDGERFDVVYHLLSLIKNLRLRVKVQVAEGDSVPTVTGVFASANWYERETYDMYGIPFEDHPDLRRILTDYDFDGFPLRKDFPLEGKVEMFYDAQQARCVYKPVSLPQEFRHFDRVSTWQGMTNNRHLAEEDNTFDSDDFKKEAKA